MKFVLVAFVLLFALNAKAEFGLGVILGSPTGFSANYILSKSNSIDAALGYDMGEDEDLHFHVDYLWRFPKSLKVERIALGWYAGVGGKYRNHDHDHDHHHGNHDHDDEDAKLGVRGVGGLNYIFPNTRIEVFGELAMVMYFISETDLDFDFGIGGRYYF